VISDSDVRVTPDYLRTIVQPLANPEIGAVTLPYVPILDRTFADVLHSIGMWSDFYAGILVARQIDGVKFALGPTIVTTRSQLSRFGGYPAIENRPGDDLLIGRLIADQGYRVELLPYPVQTVSDFASMRELIEKRLRWVVVMRHMRPWGHLGLALTLGLPWTIAAVVLSPSLLIAALYLGLYLLFRNLLMWSIARVALKQRLHFAQFALIPIWDALAFLIWITSFARKGVRWRGIDYYIRDGRLMPVPERIRE
jgi:ceramide glucosyltransferase